MRSFLMYIPAIFLLFLLIVPATTRAQTGRNRDTLTLGLSKFPKGVYRTKQEFLARKPSYTKPVLLDTNSLFEDVYSHGRSGSVALDGIDSLPRRKVKKKVFAYCTGEKLYVNTRLLGRKYGFRQILNNGPIWYLQAQDEDMFVPGGLLGYAVVKANPEGFHRIEGLYFKDEEFKLYTLKGYMLERLLSEKPDLLAKYKAEPPIKGHEFKELQARQYLDELNALKKQP